MVSEWEELEKLSKDELVIELVHWKNLYGIIRVEQDSDCPWPYAEPLSVESADGWLIAGQVTTDDWAERIALHATMHPKGRTFCSCDLMDYGLTDDQSYAICKKLFEEGRLNLPPGIELGDDF